jgi:cold shock CspA family protein
MNTGIVHFWSEETGIGYIRRKEPGPDLFFHFSELPVPSNSGRRTIKVDTLVEYTLGEFRGKPVARDIKPLTALEPEENGVQQ